MSEIRRYALKWLVFGDGPRIMAEYDGDYVLYTDHIAALEAVKAILAGTDIGSLPNDMDLAAIAQKRMDERDKFMWQVRDTCVRAEKAEEARAEQWRQRREALSNVDLEKSLNYSFRKALKQIAVPRECGCSPVCQCNNEESLRIEIDALKDIALSALVPSPALEAKPTTVDFEAAWAAFQNAPIDGALDDEDNTRTALRAALEVNQQVIETLLAERDQSDAAWRVCNDARNASRIRAETAESALETLRAALTQIRDLRSYSMRDASENVDVIQQIARAALTPPTQDGADACEDRG